MRVTLILTEGARLLDIPGGPECPGSGLRCSYLEMRPNGGFRLAREIPDLAGVQRRPFPGRAEGVLSNVYPEGAASSLRGRGAPVMLHMTLKGSAASARGLPPIPEGMGHIHAIGTRPPNGP